MGTKNERMDIAGRLCKLVDYAEKMQGCGYPGGFAALYSLCQQAADLLYEVDRTEVVDLETFIGCRRPLWIEHRTAPALSGWGMFYAEQYPLLRVETLRLGKILLAPERYGKDWVALSNEPCEGERVNLWRKEK